MTASAQPAPDLLARIWADLGGDPARLRAVSAPPHPVPLPARTGVAPLAWASCGGGLARRRGPGRRAVGRARPGSDRGRVLERAILPMQTASPSMRGRRSRASSAPRTAGCARTATIRTMRAALRRGLGLDAGCRQGRRGRRAARHAGRGCDAGDHRGGRTLRRCRARELRRRRASFGKRRSSRCCARGAHPPDRGSGRPTDAPLRGIRVLDLTRVIAGPVATRTLALLGADVLRIDPPQLPEPEWQHLDSGHGKRSTLLDLSAAGRPRDLRPPARDRRRRRHRLPRACPRTARPRPARAHRAASRHRRRAADRVGIDRSDG